jgi:predicted dehydrogenase
VARSPTELVLVGAGARGADIYASYALAHPEEARFVAVAEPDDERRDRFAVRHGIPPERRFARWQDLFARPQLAEGALVCTPDRAHVAPAVAAMTAGHGVLLEKPMAPTLAGCRTLVDTAQATGRILQICHVLRYAPFFVRLNEIVRAGRLGDIVTVEHRENVAYWHMAHSFVRGNWRSGLESSPMILAKCCHDFDILGWNLGRRCVRLSSFGSLLEYRGDRAPTGAPDRCTEACPIEKDCAFSAVGIYLENRPFPERRGQPALEAQWPASVITADQTPDGRRRALETGPYGRCVYRCDNDVVDHQVVAMELEGGVSATLVMHGHSHDDYRTVRYDGTRATLRGLFAHGTSEIAIHDHGSAAVERIQIDPAASGHGGGDHGLMAAFVRGLRGEAPPLTSASESFESHLLALAAEEARLGRKVVELDDLR